MAKMEQSNTNVHPNALAEQGKDGRQPVSEQGTLQSIENMASVSARTLAETPSAFADEIAKEFSNPQKLLQDNAMGFGIGFGATAALKKFPKAGVVVGGALLTYQAFKYGAGVAGFLSEAADADTEAQRDYLGTYGAHALGKESAVMVSTLPGFALGGGAAIKAFGTPPLYSAIGTAAKDQWQFVAPGSFRMQRGLINAERANIMTLSERLAAEHPWNGVEMARSIKLSSGRVSKATSGSEDFVGSLPFKDKSDRVLFHTHGPNSVTGVRPGTFDLAGTTDVGIITQGNSTAIYIGQAREFQAAKATSQEFAPKLQALILDHSQKTAHVVDTVWSPALGEFKYALPKGVNYFQARETLATLDMKNPWAHISKIPSLDQPFATSHEIIQKLALDKAVQLGT